MPRLFAAVRCLRAKQHFETNVNKVSSASRENFAKTEPKRESLYAKLLDLRVFIYCIHWCVGAQRSTNLGRLGATRTSAAVR